MSKHHDRSSESLDGPSGADLPQGRVKHVPATVAVPGEFEQADVLSDVLLAVRLTGAVFFPLHVSPPWAEDVPAAATLAPLILPTARHVLAYHVVMDGACWATLSGGQTVQLQPNDVIVVPHGDRHIVSSGPGVRPTAKLEDTVAFFRQMASGTTAAGVADTCAGSKPAAVVCGFLGCDSRPFNPLLENLPRLLHLRLGPALSSHRLFHLIEFALSEASQPRRGARCSLLKLSELLFVEALRLYVDALPADQRSWLAGLRDPVVGRALGLMHERPAASWTLARLGAEVGVSRSVLAERFTNFVGQPPMHYLASWRMQLAARMLTDRAAKISTIALQVGYDSEAAFSRAFKKLVGRSPSHWRHRTIETGQPAIGVKGTVRHGSRRRPAASGPEPEGR